MTERTEGGDMEYIPKIGDSIAARRRIKSKIYHNTVAGPVVETWENACHIVTNPGTEIEGSFRLYFTDWNFQYLHPSI